MRKITSVLVMLFTFLAFNATAGSGIYLRGGFNSWNAVADWEFVDEGSGVYTLANKEIKGSFKVADASWSTACNYGGTSAAIVLNEAYTLVAGSNTNLSSADTYQCSKITLTIVGGVATLLLEGEQGGSSDKTKVYMVGDFNSWDFNNTDGQLDLIDGSESIYKGTVDFGAGDTFVYWRIYEELGQVNSWGLDGNTTENTLSGTFLSKYEGCVTTMSGVYNVTFDKSTGAFELSNVSGVDAIESDVVKVVGGVGRIIVYGDVESLAIYTFNGALVSNSVSANLTAGNYIVVADGVATKVVVK